MKELALGRSNSSPPALPRIRSTRTRPPRTSRRTEAGRVPSPDSATTTTVGWAESEGTGAQVATEALLVLKDEKLAENAERLGQIFRQEPRASLSKTAGA